MMTQIKGLGLLDDENIKNELQEKHIKNHQKNKNI